MSFSLFSSAVTLLAIRLRICCGTSIVWSLIKTMSNAFIYFSINASSLKFKKPIFKAVRSPSSPISILASKKRITTVESADKRQLTDRKKDLSDKWQLHVEKSEGNKQISLPEQNNNLCSVTGRRIKLKISWCRNLDTYFSLDTVIQIAKNR